MADLIPVKVFISSPGDLMNERSVIEAALKEMNESPPYQGRFHLEAYMWEHEAPPIAGLSAQEVVNTYMLLPEKADIFICMFWHRMGTPTDRIINPDTQLPYQSGTEYEFFSAYRAFQAKQHPAVLLYRCIQGIDDLAKIDPSQLNKVNTFFKRFQSGGDLDGMTGLFRDQVELKALVRRDVTKVFEYHSPSWYTLSPTQLSSAPIYFIPTSLPDGYVERPLALEAVRKALLGSNKHVGIVAATGVHGMGGLGKTVLARALCEDAAVISAFSDGILWATIGLNPGEATIVATQRDWIQALGGNSSAVTSIVGGKVELKRIIHERAVLLILDDVWNSEDAEPFLIDGERVRVLITTRDERQAPGATWVELSTMRAEESRLVLRSAGVELTDNQAAAIAERLGDLPLALRIVGTLLADKIPWSDIHARMDKGKLADISDERDHTIFAVMDASVAYLSAEKRERYRELVIFPPDEALNVNAVARIWGITGQFDTYTTQRLLVEFQKRSLIQADNTLHDLQVDYLRATSSEEERSKWHKEIVSSYGPPEHWANLPDDDARYSWRYFSSHLIKSDKAFSLNELMRNLTYIRNKIMRLGTIAILDDCALLKEDKLAQKLASVISLSAHALDQDANQLCNQIRGRIGDEIVVSNPYTLPQPFIVLDSQTLQHPETGMLRIFTGHRGVVNDCVFSPDGQFALSASNDRTLRLWNVNNGQNIRTFEGHQGAVSSCVFSPDGQFALSSSNDKTLRLWNINSGQNIHTYEFLWISDYGCAFSPDGLSIIYSSSYHNLQMRNIESGQILGHWSIGEHFVISSNRKFILINLSFKNQGLLELSSEPIIHKINQINEASEIRAISSDGRFALLSTSSINAPLSLWHVEKGENIQTFYGRQVDITHCTFSPDGQFALSVAHDQTLRLWEVNSGKSLSTFEGHTEIINSCAISPDGQFALSASNDRTLRLWDLSSRQNVNTTDEHKFRINGCAISPDGHLALSSDDWNMQLWDVENKRSIHKFVGHSAAVNGCIFSPDGKFALSASSDWTLRLWDVSSGKSIRTYEGHMGAINSCAISPDGNFALSASRDQTLRLWKIGSRRSLRTFTGHNAPINSCAISPDGQFALSASNDRTLRLWNVNNGRCIYTFAGHTAAVNSCAFSPDGRFVLSSSDDRTLRMWETRSWSCVRIFTGHRGAVNGCAFSPDGRYVLSSSFDELLRLWEISSGQIVASCFFDAWLNCISSIGPGGSFIAGDQVGTVHFLHLNEL